MSAPIDLWPIREAIATKLGAVMTATTCLPGRWPRSVRPCICLEPASPYIGYFESFGDNGRASIQINIRVYVNTGDNDSSEIAMDAYLSPNTGRSIIDAVMADTTFGGVIETAICLNASIEETEDGLIGTLPLQIVTSKTGAS